MNLFEPADILLPKGAEMEKWAVIACDHSPGLPVATKPNTKRMKMSALVGGTGSALQLE